MKTTILATVCVCFLAVGSCGQSISEGTDNNDDSRGSMQFGLKVGANYSNVYDAEGEEFRADPKFGLATGVFLSIPIGRFLGVQPEVLFSQKGFKATGNLLGSSYEMTQTTNYIDVPLLVSLKPSQFFTILAGPQYSYLLSRKITFQNGQNIVAQEEEFDNENLRKNTFCFTGGIDVNIEHIVLSGRVGWDLFNNNGDGTTTTPRYKNAWYQLTLGFRF